MVKKIKSGKKGQVTQFISRAKAIRKLQLQLKDFRRLCILKGIYPRDPSQKKAGDKKTYYHIKDIRFLSHEKLLDKFRNIAAHLKRYRKAKIRGDETKAKALKSSTPKYDLKHLVKERYPSFVDALRDLDDPLCLVNLFATLQNHKGLGIEGQKIQTCQQLSREFYLYVAKTQSLKKVFLSIKGIYYQAQIMGQNITWIQPYQFTQKLPADVDYKVMQTFLEFYITLLKFVNLKLYSNINISYPLLVDKETDDQHYLTLKSFILKQKSSQQEDAENERYQISDQFAQQENDEQNLFKGLTFFVSRECPQYIMEFVVVNLGGEVVEDEKNATHVITDRKAENIKFQKNKEYVQPQWVCDCLNNKIVLPVADYKPGQILPPHLSPFVDNEKEGYIPTRQREIDELKGIEHNEIVEEESQDEEPEDNYDFQAEEKKKKNIQKKQQDEEKNLAKNMLSKKNRRIVNRMESNEVEKKQKAQKLAQKAKQKK